MLILTRALGRPSARVRIHTLNYRYVRYTGSGGHQDHPMQSRAHDRCMTRDGFVLQATRVSNWCLSELYDDVAKDKGRYLANTSRRGGGHGGFRQGVAGHRHE